MGHPTRDLSYRYDQQDSNYRQQPVVHNYSRPQPSAKDRGTQDINVNSLRPRDRYSYIRDGGTYQPNQSPRIYIGNSEDPRQSSRYAAPKNVKTYTIEESKAKPKRLEYPKHSQDASHSRSEIIESNPRLRPRNDIVVLPPKPSGISQSLTKGTKPYLPVQVHHQHHHQQHPQSKAQPQAQTKTNRGRHGLKIDADDIEPTPPPPPRQSRPEEVLQPSGPRPRSYSRRRPLTPPPPPTNQNGGHGHGHDQDQNRNGDHNPSAMAGRGGGSTSHRSRRGSMREVEKHVHFAT